MIEHIEIKNFKSIKSKFFPLRNLNVLLGLNGQGKSSFIQSLLLLRQSKDNLDKGVLNLNGELVRIGKAKDALYQYAKSEMVYGAKFGNGGIHYKFEYEADSDIFNIKEREGTHMYRIADEGLFSNKFQYLNADRVEPKSLHDKSYSSVSMNRSLGTKGQFTVHFLEINANESIAFENCMHPNTAIAINNKNEKFRDKRLIHQVNLWLSEISPQIVVQTDDLTSDFVQLAFQFNQPTFGTTLAFKPENVGFGISYALHVVTALLSAQPGGLIIIENPESHIHPRGQAELGKLIALVAQNNVQIIIETHSDHLLNGIRVGVKKGTIDKNNVILFYFKKVVENLEQYSSITNIELDQNGTLSEEPEGLLDEWGNQLLKLL
jgi:predicted ATPase